MSKKTETIETRVSPELKDDLSRTSDAEGRSMSDVVRDLIQARVDPPHADPSMVAARMPALRRAAMVGLPTLALAAVYLLSAQGPVAAHAEIREFFTQVDADADGRITLPEVEELIRPDWHDGIACDDGAEPCTVSSHAAFHLNRADADGSGDVSYAEFEAVNLRDWAEDFLEVDIDENGLLTVDEFVAMELYRALQDPATHAEDIANLPPACVPQFEAEEVVGLAQTCDVVAEGRQELAQFDADRDGVVTILEYLGR